MLCAFALRDKEARGELAPPRLQFVQSGHLRSVGEMPRFAWKAQLSPGYADDAVETTRASVEAATSEESLVLTDGSCNVKGIRGRGGWAALIEEGGTVREISGRVDGTTHNRMELTAICEALETLTGVVEVRTDSAYVEKCFNQNWHERWLRDGSWKGSSGPVKNRDLWERLFGLVWDERRDVTFEWIKGHAGDPNNNRVDRLARAAALSAGK
jgi:ribonuclease HI